MVRSKVEKTCSKFVVEIQYKEPKKAIFASGKLTSFNTRNIKIFLSFVECTVIATSLFVRSRQCSVFHKNIR